MKSKRSSTLTILLPDDVMADLRALRAASCQSTNDLLNDLIAAELAARADEVEEGRSILLAEEERKARARARAEERRASLDKPPAVRPSRELADHGGAELIAAPAVPSLGSSAEGIPSDEDVEDWAQLAKTPDDRTRDRREGLELVKWLRVEKLPLTREVIDGPWAEIIAEKHPKQSTQKKSMAAVRRLCAWWASKGA